MITFLVAGMWCEPSYPSDDPPILQTRRDGYWRTYQWMSLGFLTVRHPEHGEIKIVPTHYPWRFS